MRSAHFEHEVDLNELQSFALLSGDYNPLHVDQIYAKQTPFKRQVLHGAYSAGLISRLAGMQLPGVGCLLHSMQLTFVAPILPPVRLSIVGHQTSGDTDIGRVDVTVSDAQNGRIYVEGSYQFSRTNDATQRASVASEIRKSTTGKPKPIVLVSGAGGGLGRAVLARLGEKAVGWSRSGKIGSLAATSIEKLEELIGDQLLSAIVHCAWPMPDNRPILERSGISDAINHHVSQPLSEAIALAQILSRRGTSDAILVLVGSTFARPGRHSYRTPLYSLAKSLMPTLSEILAIELGSTGKRSATVVFDVLDGGMNSSLSKGMKISHADRLPAGDLPDMAEAAEQIAWILDNRGRLISGATLTLTGGAIP